MDEIKSSSLRSDSKVYHKQDKTQVNKANSIKES